MVCLFCEFLHPNCDVKVASTKLISNCDQLFSDRTHLDYLCAIPKRFQEKGSSL